MEMGIDKGLTDEVARGIDDTTSLRVDAWVDRGDSISLDADVGDVSIGQRAPL